jgi:hypothetical protein
LQAALSNDLIDISLPVSATTESVVKSGVVRVGMGQLPIVREPAAKQHALALRHALADQSQLCDQEPNHAN